MGSMGAGPLGTRLDVANSAAHPHGVAYHKLAMRVVPTLYVVQMAITLRITQQLHLRLERVPAGTRLKPDKNACQLVISYKWRVAADVNLCVH